MSGLASGESRGHPALDGDYWNRVAAQIERSNFLPDAISGFRASAMLNLLGRWCDGDLHRGRVLKTDCYEEAFSPRSFLLSLAAEKVDVTAIDISSTIVRRASQNALRQGLVCPMVTCDVRQLPFDTGSFDLIVSHSTLDHFSRDADLGNSLRELRRVLCSGGQLILTLDNASNLCDPLVRLAKRWSPYYVGRSFKTHEVVRAIDEVQMEVEETGYLAHSPRIVDIVTARLCAALGSRRLDAAVQRGLETFSERCARSPLEPFLGTYVAVKAIKN